jgi:hypothetical protein
MELLSIKANGVAANVVDITGTHIMGIAFFD